MAGQKDDKRSATGQGSVPARHGHDSRPKIEKLENGLPVTVFAQASPRSLGSSLFQSEGVDSANVTAVMSEESVVLAAASQLETAGFEILNLSNTTINISGPPALYESAFNCSLLAEERPVRKEQSREDTATFVECPQTELPGLIDTAGTDFAGVLEGVALEVPRYFFSADALSPTAAYWHLDVPAGVSLGCNADKAHRSGVTGRGIKVVMVDSGHFAHPYFSARGYRVGPVILGPAAANPAADESGHGTAESANVFSVAPDVDFSMVKVNFVNSTGAFNAAVGLAPDIISNSWGSDTQFGPLGAADLALSAAIAAAVASGILVIFSAGNGHFGFPGQHPDVISAGGVYMERDGSLQASDYASGFSSNIFPGRNVPDLSGLVGMRPRAAYIMLPVEPDDDIDQDLGNGQPHPNGDETAPDDGWAAISGTSAAAPQLAGAAALVKQACPGLTPVEVKDVLRTSARDVTAGRCFNRPGMNHQAVAGPDLATGTGLVDAHRAVLIAKLRCLGPIGPVGPIVPITPITPIRPIRPITPITPVGPVQPIGPIRPITPVGPIGPIRPIQPIDPISPVINPGPVEQAGTGNGPDETPAVQGLPLSAEDVKALEQIIRETGDGLGL